MTTSMTHRRVVAASVDDVYRMVADVTLWPVIFSPTVHLQHLERSEHEERFQLWAMVAGKVQTWVSRRRLDPLLHRITFRQEQSHPPVVGMSGSWTFTRLPGGHTEVVLDHAFDVTHDEALPGISSAVDRNSTEELAALGRIAELGRPVEEVVDRFSDTVVMDGPLAEIYDFVYRSDLWPGRLPHVARVALTEDEPGIQDMTMETVTADGARHTTRSIRVCVAGSLVAYKQLVPPAILLGHSGQWTFSQRGHQVEVMATHTVAIDFHAARSALGGNSTLDQVREHVRQALGGNGRATLAHAGAFVAGRR
jgi:aromatase